MGRLRSFWHYIFGEPIKMVKCPTCPTCGQEWDFAPNLPTLVRWIEPERHYGWFRYPCGHETNGFVLGSGPGWPPIPEEDSN